jgi:hypothetical protein
MDASMDTNQAGIDANNEKFVVLRSTLVSRMDIHQARTEAVQEEIIDKMDARQDRIAGSVNACRNKMKARREETEVYPERTKVRIS